jgi:hypothetical protein
LTNTSPAFETVLLIPEEKKTKRLCTIVTPDNANRWIWTEGKKNGRTTPIVTIKQMNDMDRWKLWKRTEKKE